MPKEEEKEGSVQNLNVDNDAMRMGKKTYSNNLIDTINENDEEEFTNTFPKRSRKLRMDSAENNAEEENQRQEVISRLPMDIQKLFHIR
jgi:hypothetical protein